MLQLLETSETISREIASIEPEVPGLQDLLCINTCLGVFGVESQ